MQELRIVSMKNYLQELQVAFAYLLYLHASSRGVAEGTNLLNHLGYFTLPTSATTLLTLLLLEKSRHTRECCYTAG